MAVELTRPAPDIFNAIYFNQLVASFARFQSEKQKKELTLTERIAKFGKIRFLFVCDENLGRSPMFAAALKKRLKSRGLSNFAEVLSAGTEVTKRGSDQKFSGGAHPAIIDEMNNIPGIEIENHVVTQFSADLITPNTILFVLSDINKIPLSVRKKCFSVLDCGIADPYETKDKTPLSLRLMHLHDKAYYFTWEILLRLLSSIKNNNLDKFVEKEKINFNDYMM